MGIGTNLNKSVNKTLYYKRIEFDDPDGKLNGKNLQTLIVEAVTKVDQPMDRSEQFDEDSDLRRVVGHYKFDRKMLCGQVMKFEEGMDVAFLVQDPETSLLEVERRTISAATEDQDDKKREVLQGALFFVVFENHMTVLQSQSVSFKSLELHINWLLKECSGVLDNSIGVILNNEPVEKAVAAMSNGDFKSFKIGTPVRRTETTTKVDAALSTGGENDQFKDTTSVKTQIFADGYDAIKALFKGAWDDQLELPEDTDFSNLKVTVEVKYQQKSSKEARKWLDQLARASRHYDPEDTVIETASGRTITGNELRMKERRTVIVNNGVIDRSSAYDALQNWLRDLVSEKLIG